MAFPASMGTSPSDSIVDKIENDTRNIPWYQVDVRQMIKPDARVLLERYVGIPADQVDAVVAETRAKAWDISPWPSVGALTWLSPYMPLSLAYDRILGALKNGASIVDCGCMIAPDLRRLAFDGAPTDRMAGFDIEPRWFELGHDFYRDRATFRAQFFAADVTKEWEADGASELAAHAGTFDIVWAAKLLHIFDRPAQLACATRLVRLLRPRAGSMFCGSQNGYPGSFRAPLGAARAPGQTDHMWLADAESLRAMWDEVAEATGTKWEVEARLFDLRTIGWHKDDGSDYKKRTGYNLQWTATLVDPGSLAQKP